MACNQHRPDVTELHPRNLWFDIVSPVAYPTLCKGTRDDDRTLRVLTNQDFKRLHGALFAKVACDVPRLLEVMRETNALMGGSAVLQMLCPLFEGVPDYDIFVPLEAVDVLVQYLITVEGYDMDDMARGTETNGCVVDDVRYLSGIATQVTLKKAGVVVDVIGVGAGDGWDRPEVAIASAWTTLLMNYAGPDWINVGYPTLTLLGRGLIQWDRARHPSFPSGTCLREVEKYVERGYEFRTHADDWDTGVDGELRTCEQSWVCPLKQRAFGDAGCLWVPVGPGARRALSTRWVFGGVPCPLVCDREESGVNEVHVDYCACGSRR